MTARQRALVFGEAAEHYHRVRPGYPQQLPADVLAQAAPGPVLEVGAGTGLATAGFAAHGVELTCVEPDPRMAELLRRNVPGVRVVESTFEAWQPDRAYGLLFSAQAWHWVDPASRYERAHAALAPGGLFAPFWNIFLIVEEHLRAELTAVDAEYGVDSEHTPHGLLAAHHPAEPAEFDVEWTALQLPKDLFTGEGTLRYHSTRSFTAAAYRDHLSSLSIYRVLPPETAEAALDAAERVVAAHGNAEFVVYTDVALTRRR